MQPIAINGTPDTDHDGDRRAEIPVTSPWGIGVLRRYRTTYRAVMLEPNGNPFGPVGDFDGDGQDELVISSPLGIGIFKLFGNSFEAVMIAPNGTQASLLE